MKENCPKWSLFVVHLSQIISILCLIVTSLILCLPFYNFLLKPQCLDVLNFLFFPSNSGHLHSTFYLFFILLQQLTYFAFLLLITFYSCPAYFIFHSALRTATLLNQFSDIFFFSGKLDWNTRRWICTLPKFNNAICVYWNLKSSRESL